MDEYVPLELLLIRETAKGEKSIRELCLNVLSKDDVFIPLLRWSSLSYVDKTHSRTRKRLTLV